jgi:hypothetical protein
MEMKLVSVIFSVLLKSATFRCVWYEKHTVLMSRVVSFPTSEVRSLNLHAGELCGSLVTFGRAGVGLQHVTTARRIKVSYLVALSFVLSRNAKL